MNVCTPPMVLSPCIYVRQWCAENSMGLGRVRGLLDFNYKGRNQSWLSTSTDGWDSSTHSPINKESTGVPEWIRRLSVQLLISGQVLTSGSWVQALHWAPCWMWSLFKKKKPKKTKNLWKSEFSLGQVKWIWCGSRYATPKYGTLVLRIF